jgi:hypothetical protein
LPCKIKIFVYTLERSHNIQLFPATAKLTFLTNVLSNYSLHSSLHYFNITPFLLSFRSNKEEGNEINGWEVHKKMIRGRQQNALEMWEEKWRQKFINVTVRLGYVQKLPIPWGMQ